MYCGGRVDLSTGGQGRRLKRLKTADPNLPGAKCNDGPVLRSVFMGRARFMIEQKASSLHGGE